MEACQADENIFKLLQKNRLYDVNDLKRIKLFTITEESSPTFETDLSTMELLTLEEKERLTLMRTGNFSSYHSNLYHENLCTNYGKSLVEVNTQVRNWVRDTNAATEVLSYFLRGSILYTVLHGMNINKYFHQKLVNSIKELEKTVDDIDRMILYESHDFNNSILILFNSIIDSEKFIQGRGKDFINTIASNLTDELNAMVDNFIHKVVRESTDKVGQCAPLSYIYNRSFQYICERLVDPIVSIYY